MNNQLIENFHLLPVKNSPVVFHSLSYRFFEVDDFIAETISQLENGNTVEDEKIKYAIESINCKIIDHQFQLEINDQGDNKDYVAFYLFISQDCNLNCTYCYGGGGNYGKKKMLMSKDVLNNFMDRFLTGEHHSYMINFFGGEPLMNFPIMKNFVDRAKEKAKRLNFHIMFNITTNGTLWNKKIHDFLKNDITNITVSLDGPKSINDTQRLPIGNFSPHDRTINTLKILKEMDDRKFVIRSILTKNSYGKIGEIYRYNHKLAPGGVGLTPMDSSPDHLLAINDDEYKAIVDEIVMNNLDSLNDFIKDNPSDPCEYVFDIFNMIFFKKYRKKPCNACRSFIAVGADGDIYPCHRFVGINDFKLGNVSQPETWNNNYQKIHQELDHISVDTIPQCQRCWARYLCGGACYVIAFLREGKVNQPSERYCYLKKTIYHQLLQRFIEIMSDPVSSQKLHNNVIRLIQGTNA